MELVRPFDLRAHKNTRDGATCMCRVCSVARDDANTGAAFLL
jgi:hypothetical protein